MIEEGDETVIAPKVLFNRPLETGKIVQEWKEGITILLHKKDDKQDLKNYRPITLILQLYKLLSGILTKMLNNKVEMYLS